LRVNARFRIVEADFASAEQSGRKRVTAHGLLPRVLAFATARNAQQQQIRNAVSISVVAGEGLEPPTLGL
jgi:hypothetical protein